MGISLALSASGLVSLWERLSVWYQTSFLSELFDYLSERYFRVEFGAYDNFSVSSGTGSVVRNIILALAVGFVVAALMTAYTRVVLGGFVRKLIADDALDAGRARSIMELGYFRSVAIRYELSRGSSLRMVVRSVEENTDAPAAARKKERVDFLSARFYIPEELRYRAETRFDKKGSGWLPVILVIVAVIVAASLLCLYLPDVLQLADNLITVLSPN